MTLRDEISKVIRLMYPISDYQGMVIQKNAADSILAIFQKRLDEIRTLSFHSASFGLYEGDEEIKNLQQQLLYASQRFEKIAALCNIDEPEQDENKPKVDKAQIWKATDFGFWTLSDCRNNHFITGDIIVGEIDRVVMWIDNASMGQFTDEIISDHCTYVGNYKDRIMELIKEHAE